MVTATALRKVKSESVTGSVDTKKVRTTLTLTVISIEFDPEASQPPEASTRHTIATTLPTAHYPLPTHHPPTTHTHSFAPPRYIPR